jgi:hypothetical protein
LPGANYSANHLSLSLVSRVDELTVAESSAKQILFSRKAAVPKNLSGRGVFLGSAATSADTIRKRTSVTFMDDGYWIEAGGA